MRTVSEAGTETVGLVQQFLERAGQLYSLPAVAAEILRLTDQPQIDPRAIKKCLESDPALAARILRVANSSLFGATRHVTDLNQALTLLGIRPLKMLVLGFSLPKELLAGLQADVLASYWRQALTKAVAARELCEQLWHTPGEEAFLAGLIQDIGALVLLKELGPSYEQLLNHAQTHGCSLLECELDTLGFDHLVLSARLLSHWGLPAEFCAAISVPPDENRIADLSDREAQLPRILHLAHLISQVIERPYGHSLSELLAVGTGYCHLNYEKLQPIVAAVEERVSEMAEAWSLALPDGRSCLELLAEAHERLADECLYAASSPNRRGDEIDLLRLTENLRDDVARCARGEQSHCDMDEDTASTDARRASAKAGQRTTVDEGRYEPALEAQVEKAIQHARQGRQPVNLAVLELDDFSRLIVRWGPERAGELIFELRQWLSERDEQCSPLLLSDSRLAIIWENTSRGEAVDISREILENIHSEFGLPNEFSLSIGLAALEFAPKNYPPRQLVEAAFSCLSAAQLSGGGTVKSIAV
jgi:HD-like signal output (HDOD) protein/GGDEF domain-containing protein